MTQNKENFNRNDYGNYEPLFRPGEVARIFHISESTLIKWRKKGIIRGIELRPNVFRYPKSELDRLIGTIGEQASKKDNVEQAVFGVQEGVKKDD
ncbi:MAG: helix-turn-helix domain-containing protein [Thermoprotei archaeon]